MIMANGAKATWSMETYTIHDVVYKMGLPRTVRVMEGIYSQNEQESLSTGDVIRLDAISEIKRVITRASLTDGEVTDLQIPLSFQGQVYVYTGTETVYKSVQELIQLFPGNVHVDSPIKAVVLNTKDEEDMELPRGTCLRLDGVVSGQGLHCTLGTRKLCLRPFQRGRFSRIPKNDIMYLKDVIRNFSLPVNVRFMGQVPELGQTIDVSKVSYFSLERVESVIAIVGHELDSEGTRLSDSQLSVALTQATDVEVQVSRAEEAKSPPPRSPNISPNIKIKRPPPVPKRSSSIPHSFGKTLPLPQQKHLNQTKLVDNSNVQHVPSQQQVSGGNKPVLSSFGSKAPIPPPRKMSSPDSFPSTRPGTVDPTPDSKCCAVPPLPLRKRPPSDGGLPNQTAKLETGLILNKLPPDIGKKLFNDIEKTYNRSSKSNTPTGPLSNRTSTASSGDDSGSSDDQAEADYISMSEAKEISRQRSVKVPASVNQTKSSNPRSSPAPPPRDRGSGSSQKFSLPEHSGPFSQQQPPRLMKQSTVSPETSPVPPPVTPFRAPQPAAPPPGSAERNAVIRSVNKDIGVVNRYSGAMSQPDASQNLDEFYRNIPKTVRKSMVLLHKEFFTRQIGGHTKPTGAVSPMSRGPSPMESNFSNLSVSDTVRCFRECRLNELADLCEKEVLDGCFIDKLTNEELSQDPFNLSVLHRMKVEQIKQGWRPFNN